MAPSLVGLGMRIRLARTQYGMAQSELARRVGLSATALNDIEHGRTVDPRWSVVGRIANTLGVSLDSLSGEECVPLRLVGAG